MTEQLHGNALWHLVMQSDAITKCILIVLFCMNVLCTTVFLYKWLLMRIKERETKKTLHALKECRTFDDVRITITEFSTTWPGYLLKRFFNAVKAQLERHPLTPTLSERELASVEGAIEQSLDEMIQAEQSYLPILYSCAAVSPLIGLFGTVWGLVHSFINISQRQSADIATVAPGIAEALITTLAGLCVAIPALMMYHYLANRVKHLEQRLILVADRAYSMVVVLFGNGE